jgi:hypothetical protein
MYGDNGQADNKAGFLRMSKDCQVGLPITRERNTVCRVKNLRDMVHPHDFIIKMYPEKILVLMLMTVKKNMMILMKR